ncbi:hypothetical protein IFM89_032771, partial [Coptis chinensis]
MGVDRLVPTTPSISFILIDDAFNYKEEQDLTATLKSINVMDPNTKSILQLLRLRQDFAGLFLIYMPSDVSLQYQYDEPKYQKYFAAPPFET